MIRKNKNLRRLAAYWRFAHFLGKRRYDFLIQIIINEYSRPCILLWSFPCRRFARVSRWKGEMMGFNARTYADRRPDAQWKWKLVQFPLPHHHPTILATSIATDFVRTLSRRFWWSRSVQCRQKEKYSPSTTTVLPPTVSLTLSSWSLPSLSEFLYLKLLFLRCRKKCRECRYSLSWAASLFLCTCLKVWS